MIRILPLQSQNWRDEWWRTWMGWSLGYDTKGLRTCSENNGKRNKHLMLPLWMDTWNPRARIERQPALPWGPCTNRNTPPQEVFTAAWRSPRTVLIFREYTYMHSPLSRGTPRIFFKKLWAPKDSMHRFLHGLRPSTPCTISNSKIAATFRTWRLPPFNTTHGCIGDVTYALRDPSTAIHAVCNAKEVYRESH